MFAKLRPNVLLLGALVGAMTMVLALQLIGKTEAIVSNEILALLVGVGLGGLVGVMSAVAQDPPPPTIPAETFEKYFSLEAVEVEIECECDKEA